MIPGRAALALVLVAMSTRASADTLRGKRLYLDASNLLGTPESCVDCHGGLPGGAFGIGAAANDPALVEMAVESIPQMIPFRGRLTAADFVDLASYIGDPAVPSPDVRVGADRILFEELEVDDRSEPAMIEVRNAGAVAFTITAAPVLSGDAFVLESSDCTAGLVLTASVSCRVAVAFAPTTVASHTGRVTVAHDWVRGAVAVALRGTSRDQPEMMVPPSSSGCAAGRETGLWVVLALGGLARRR